MLPLSLSHLPRPPAPTRLIRTIDPRVPLVLKRQLIEPLLNRTFAEPLAEGEFDALEGRRISLHIEDLGVALTLTLEAERFRLSPEAGEATIRGGWREFLCREGTGGNATLRALAAHLGFQFMNRLLLLRGSDSFLCDALGGGGVARQDGPVDAVRLRGLGDAFDRMPDLGMLPVADDAHREHLVVGALQLHATDAGGGAAHRPGVVLGEADRVPGAGDEHHVLRPVGDADALPVDAVHPGSRAAADDVIPPPPREHQDGGDGAKSGEDSATSPAPPRTGEGDPPPRRAAIGAQILTPKDLPGRGNILSALQGVVPGLQASGRREDAGVRARQSHASMLFVVDGTVITPPLTFYIDTQDVECVEVRRGYRASQEFRPSINGQTYSGVILIWTKGGLAPKPRECQPS